MLVHCPSCDAEMEPQAAACPICLRKRTRQEIFAGLRGEDVARAPKRASGGGGGRAALYLLAGAACAAFAYTRWQPATPAETPPPASKEDVSIGLPQAVQAAPLPAPAEGAAESLPQAAPAAPPAAAPKTHWLVKGRVYDLLSLQPLAGARVVLRDSSSGDAHRAQSDARGAFAVRVPKLDSGGYVLDISRKGYRKDYLEDEEPSLLSKGPAARRDAVRMVEESSVLHVPLLPTREEDELSSNYFLIPARPL